MKTLQQHLEELIKNLTTDGWKAVLKDLDSNKDLYCVKAQKRFLVFFNKVHIYIVINQVDSDTLEEIIKLIKNKFFNYHAIWIAADSFTKEVKEYAQKTKQIGLIKIDLK